MLDNAILSKLFIVASAKRMYEPYQFDRFCLILLEIIKAVKVMKTCTMAVVRLIAEHINICFDHNQVQTRTIQTSNNRFRCIEIKAQLLVVHL